MAIIKKFNKALQNVSGEVSASESDPARRGISIGEGDLEIKLSESKLKQKDAVSDKPGETEAVNKIRVGSFDKGEESVEKQ